MNKTRKRRLKSVLSMALIVAMVCSCIPYWPTGIFMLSTKAATPDDGVTALLADWTVSNTDSLTTSVGTDEDGTKVLTMDQSSQASSMSGSFETATRLKYTPENVAFSDGYTISADIKVTNVAQLNNSSGIGIGDMVSSGGNTYYAYGAYRASGNAKAVYSKVDGSYGSTDIGSAASVTVDTEYAFSYKKVTTGYMLTLSDGDSMNQSKTISSGNVNASFFDTEVMKTTSPVILLEGVKVEIRNLKVLDNNGDTLYDMQTSGATAYHSDCMVNIGDANVSSYTLGGTYSATPIVASLETDLASALTDGATLSVVKNASDTAADTLGTYSATVDAAQQKIIVKAGTTIIGEIKYRIAGEVKRLALDADEVTYSFTKNIFGLDTALQVLASGITSEDGCLTIYGNGMKWHDGTHGASIYAGDKLSINVPAGQTTLTFNVCAYSKATAVAKVDGNQVGETISLMGDGVNDTSETSFIYTASKDTTIDIEMIGNGYLHYIKAKAESVQPVATVTGKVNGVDGEVLEFYKGTAKVGESTIENGNYQVSLPIGSKYSVRFADTDSYEVTQGADVDLTETQSGAKVSNDISYAKWNATKAFSLSIGGTVFQVGPGNTESADFVVTAGEGGQTEVTTASESLVWADLGGNGTGILSAGDITNVSDNITTAISGNEIIITYKDTANKPLSYRIAVKDNSAAGTPKQDGMPATYTFTEKSVIGQISSLHAKGSKYTIEDVVTSSDKLVSFAKGIYFNDTTHGIGVSAGAEISVKVAGDAMIDFSNCAYSSANVQAEVKPSEEEGSGIVTPSDSISTKAGVDGDVQTFTYKGSPATITFTFTGGSAYIHSMTVTNAAPKADEHTQAAMPSVRDYSAKDALTVSPVGQRLVLKQTGGNLNTVDESINSSVSYYGFDTTADATKLTADVMVNTCGSSNYNGIFFGAFNGTYMATVGIRNATGLRGIYSKSRADMAGAGGINTSIAAGTIVSFTAEKFEDGFIITAATKGEKDQSMTFKYNSDSYPLLKSGENTELSYGLVLANATATVSNMKYYAADGTVLYDQNACYDAKGTAPVVDKVTAEAASTRDSIAINWSNTTEIDGDGKYVVQVSRDGSEWTDIATEITDKTFDYAISEAGTYQFRVCGKLGVNGERNTYVLSNKVVVIAALTTPVVSISATESVVSLGWEAIDKANRYEVYRYSYDETEANATKVATVTDTSYADKDIVEEMPYYYYVVAYSVDNYSNPSETVWTVPTKGHTGSYVYEENSTGITITKKSYDTVYNGKITLEGVVEKSANVVLQVNGVNAAQEAVSERGTFSFTDIAIKEGRNDVNLLVTDSNGDVTRQTFNFVYLTNYDKVVNETFSGNDGALNEDGVPTYKTVQAAVDSVSQTNEQRVVILVKEGNYEENLQVNAPNIALVGEDSTKTRIFYNTKDNVGGDMSKRCAVCIQKNATSFSAENLTFENSYQYLGDGSLSNESCDALRNDANNTSYINVRILGYQDTLCANQGTQYYYKCYITGNVDFIYGNEPRALFNDCQLVFRYAANKNSGYVCAPKTSVDAAYGLTFNNCQILSENGCSGSKYYLARPWGADAYITWIDCYMGKIIKANAANPYSDMSGNAARAARFYEYGSYGSGYTIDAFRRQISTAMAHKMLTTTYLSWDPYTSVLDIGSRYIGKMNTAVSDRFVTATYVTDTTLSSEGDDTGLEKYAMEGYAESDGVTGGGNLYETSDNYYKVANAQEFLDALVSAKSSGRASVIELTNDIALGSKEVANYSSYSAAIKAHTYQPLTHPTLKETGVSTLMLSDMSNLTIYSKEGAKITHACTDISGSSNVIIRNIKFDELWEWDEDTLGAYDRNDWDYLTVEKGSAGIWVDHCTFYKAYDGVIDVKTPSSASNITISWCQFLPASENNTFFDAMMSAMSSNPENYPYYSHLLKEGMTEDQINGYAYGQKKTHLFGQSDTDASAQNIYVTLANNYYKDSMDRMPRLRYGTAHVYNCIMDAQNLREIRASITKPELASKIVSNGSSSTCGAHMLLENCYLSGITNALNSGNGDSPAGYINAVNSKYLMDGVSTTLGVENNNTIQDGKLIQDTTAFTTALPYNSYTLYSADSLSTNVKPYTGAGKLTMTTLQWEKTSYTADNHVWDDGVIIKEPTTSETGVKLYTCQICGETKTEILPVVTVDIHVELGENVPVISLGNSKDELLSILTDEEKKMVDTGAEFKISAKILDYSGKVSEEDKATVKKVLAGYAIGQYLDITLFKQVGNSQIIQISETSSDVSIKIAIPENLKNTDASKRRTYKIVRIHNGESTVLDGVYSELDGTFTFLTDKFSTYVIIYQDAIIGTGSTDVPGNPGTGEKASEGQNNTIADPKITNETDSAPEIIPGSVIETETNTETNTNMKAIDGVDTLEEQSPSTGDATVVWWFLLMFVISGGAIYIIGKKKKYSFK